jgi:hypothetical protein
LLPGKLDAYSQAREAFEALPQAASYELKQQMKDAMRRAKYEYDQLKIDIECIEINIENFSKPGYLEELKALARKYERNKARGLYGRGM